MKKTVLWKRILLFILCSFITVIAIAGVAVYAFMSKIQTPVLNETPVMQTASNDTASANQSSHRINILLLGVDDGDPDIPGSPRRSDTMMVASIDTEHKAINLLSLPRDSRVLIPGHDGYDKITHAYFYGGADLAVRTVKEFLHIPIDYYVVIDWRSFIKVVDILGGVNLYVAHDMNYEDPYENLSIHLTKGNQHLDGEKAGQYVRFRHDELGDIGRVERQELFLKALNNQMLQSGTILKLPALMTTVSKYVHTDMNLYALVKIATQLKDMSTNSLHTAMLPGDFATLDNLSYWLPDTNKTEVLVKSMFYDVAAQ